MKMKMINSPKNSAGKANNPWNFDMHDIEGVVLVSLADALCLVDSSTGSYSRLFTTTVGIIISLELSNAFQI